ncbi:MAG: nitroreductase family protein [Anaerolineae bacterium]|jgi:nitroreductase
MVELMVENLFARRSVRRFTEAPVTTEQRDMLLQAAMAAPSAGNRRPWHFIVVTDRETRARLADSSPYAGMVARAPLCIVPCGEPALGIAGRPDFWVQDLSAATENLLLAAVGLGLGAVWCGIYPLPERVSAARDILGIPGDMVPFAYVAIGQPAEHPEPRTQYDPARVRHERW